MKLNRSIPTTFWFLALFLSLQAFAQTKHTVSKGETITQIAQKYKVTPYDIYGLNPDSQGGIHENDIILIPASGKEKSTTSTTAKSPGNTPATHTVEAKETLYSISKKYGITVDELKAMNPFLADGLKTGQVLKLSASKSVSETVPAKKPAPVVTVVKPAPSETKNAKAVSHIVEPKETKFGIAKKYGLTVAELERQNPGTEQNLPVGYKLMISGSASDEKPKAEPKAEPVAEKPKPQVTDIESEAVYNSQPVKTVKRTGFANYEVKPGETIFSLTQSLGVTQEELIKLNPTLKDGLKTGMILKVPGKGSIMMETRKGFDDLAKSISKKDRKQLVLLLPFNASKIQGDTVKTLSSRLKKDAFLNMTLDFYAGALMAIDSAKTLGMNIDVKIFDSEESKMSSSVASIIQSNKLDNADAVIGPFYQQHAEKAAELLNKNNVAVISPLSKEVGKPFSNLYQAMPSTDYGKKAMLDYLVSKNGNIIVVADPKRTSNRDMIMANYTEVHFAEMAENGSMNPEKLKSLFVTDKMNYVILDSEKTGMILSTTNLLLNEMANYQLQLAILEPNETLDYEEVSMKRLTILKMLYPSLTRENNTPEAILFENEFKRKNKIFPSQYAVRGFDVTFDTMLRLSQGKTFAESAASDKTERVESKFDYGKNEPEGYMNKGIYILQYEDDLSVKEAN
jgi:LysM repeat protein